jgi:hypothetical protein
VAGARCDAHQRADSWSRGQHGRAMPAGWAATRARILWRDPVCRIGGPRCTIRSTEVDHISGDSMLRLISVAYRWPLNDIAQRAVVDAATVDEALQPELRQHLVNQYGYLLQASREIRAAQHDDFS